MTTTNCTTLPLCTTLPRVPQGDRLFNDRVDKPCSARLGSSTKPEMSSAVEGSTGAQDGCAHSKKAETREILGSTIASVAHCAASGSKFTAASVGARVANAESLSPWQRPMLPSDADDGGQGQSSLSSTGMTNSGRWFYNAAVANSNALNPDHDIYGRVSMATDAGLSSTPFGWYGSYGPAVGEMTPSYSTISSTATREIRAVAQQSCHMATPFRVTARPLPGPYFYGYSDSDNCTKF